MEVPAVKGAILEDSVHYVMGTAMCLVQTDDNAGAVSPSESQQAAFSMQQPAQGHADHEQKRAVPAVHGQSDDCIEMRRLHRFFGTTKAVQDISFSVKRGLVFGYIGPNGAGKTTSMRIMATLDLPSYGDVFIDGLSCVNDPELVRNRLGFMHSVPIGM